MAQRICPECRGRNMSSFIKGRRTGMWRSTCRDCGFTDRCTTPPEPPAGNLPEVRPASTFVPNTEEPPAPKPDNGALSRFERAHVAGTVRHAIQANRRQLRQVEPLDGRAKQLGEDR